LKRTFPPRKRGIRQQHFYGKRFVAPYRLPIFFLPVVTQAPSPAAIAEVEYARDQNKLIIPIVGPYVDRHFLQSFPQAFYIEPSNPGQVETDILNFLQQSHTKKSNRNLFIGLSALAVGLLLLSTTSE